MEILDFLLEDKDYIKDQKEKIDNILSDIFKGFEISAFTDEFITRWKGIDFENIFGEASKNIPNLMINLVKNFKDFGVLWKVLNISTKDTEKKYSNESINLMQSKFIKLLKENDKWKETDIKDDLVELIYYSDKRNSSETSHFLNDIQDIINFITMKNIYCESLRKYQDKITEDSRNIIAVYLIGKQGENLETIIEFAEKYEIFLNNILDNIKNYKLQKEDLLKVEENYRIKLFKELLIKAQINKEEIKEGNEYVIESIGVIEEVEKDLDNNLVLYKDINPFFQSNNTDDFYNRLLLIYFNNRDKAISKRNEIQEKVKAIYDALLSLKFIVVDMKDFFVAERAELVCFSLILQSRYLLEILL